MPPFHTHTHTTHTYTHSPHTYIYIYAWLYVCMYVMCRCLQCMGIVLSVEILCRSVNAFGSRLPATSVIIFFLHLNRKQASSGFCHAHFFFCYVQFKTRHCQVSLQIFCIFFFFIIIILLLPHLRSLFKSTKFMIWFPNSTCLFFFLFSRIRLVTGCYPVRLAFWRLMSTIVVVPHR